MNKLILFAAALMLVGQASANAQSRDRHGEHGAISKHRRVMSAHARWQGYEPGINYRTRGLPSIMTVPSYGYGGYGYGGYGGHDEYDNANGRTNGG